MAAGANSGVIHVQNVKNGKNYTLKLDKPIPSTFGMINDMLYLSDGKLANCYNNGSLAIWNLRNMKDNAPPISYTKVHDSYFYKIRRVDPQTLLTCSNDKSVSLFDLETCEVLENYPHQDGVWCAYPLS